MSGILKKNKLSVVVLVAYVLLMIVRRDMAFSALGNSTYYLIEMAQILPVIFMLTVSIDVLIPKEWIVKRLGKQSGIIGAALALAFGSLSAGPIYAAFPIAKTLHKKGASVANIVIILSAWAVIKVPMLANEAKFLGPDFMLVRWILTVVFILAIGIIMEKLHIEIHGEDQNQVASVAVRADYCMGCSACVKGMPDVFGMKEGKAYVLDANISLDTFDEEKRMNLYDLVEKCPPKAIEVNG